MAAAKKSPLANAFKDDEDLQPVASPVQKAGNGRRLITEGTSLVAANLPVQYNRRITMLAAEEGVTKKDLMQEAFDLLFATRGGKKR
ncbi:ribbon-helix-helix domain-containing protein [Allorhizobium undicola]|uniref:ribbon-helix-helix domain-containing protein n=1 Tax=Allorhizobium undicola TaxID=78527 RepID=UPI003D32E910